MDLKAVCRTCLRIPKQPVNLFDGDGSLLQKINKLVLVEIKNTDQLSTIICQECFKLINDLFNFQKVVKNTEQDLISRLITLNKTKGLIKRKASETAKINTNCMTNKEIQPQKNNRNVKQYKINNQHKANSPRSLLKKTHPCPKCGKIFRTARRLQAHSVSHRPKCVCNICGVTIGNINYRKHVKSHTDKPCRCDICGKECKHSLALYGHKRFIHSEKKFTCETCGKMFVSMSTLREHMKSHTNPERNRQACHLCGKIVKTLSVHMLSHSGEKRYTCPHCNKHLSTSYSLKLHIRLHTGEKPFACSYCDKSFRQSGSLKFHKKTAHGIS